MEPKRWTVPNGGHFKLPRRWWAEDPNFGLLAHLSWINLYGFWHPYGVYFSERYDRWSESIAFVLKSGGKKWHQNILISILKEFVKEKEIMSYI